MFSMRSLLSMCRNSNDIGGKNVNIHEKKPKSICVLAVKYEHKNNEMKMHIALNEKSY